MSTRIRGVYRFVFWLERRVLPRFTQPDWKGMENLPRRGGFILAPNHISNFDPVYMDYFMLSNGIPIRFMAKDSLFRVPVVGWFMRRMKMVPVRRGGTHARDSLFAARAALRAGEAIGIYVEGTITRDPEYWPMRPKTGAARLALELGVPVIPVAQWGAQTVMDRYSKCVRPWGLHRMTIRVLPPLDLSDLLGRQGDREAVHEASWRIQRAITAGVQQIRGGQAPLIAWDPQREGGPDKKTLGRFSNWRHGIERMRR